MLSNTSKYAIRAVIYLALYSTKEKKVGIKKIAEDLDIPTPFLGKILQLLAKEEILYSIKGPHGGFTLQRPAIDISLMEIVQIIDGNNSFDQCVIRTETCRSDAPCSLHHKIAPFRNGIRSLMLTESIADLASEFRSGKESINL